MNFFEKTLAFLKDMRYNNIRRLERYSNGKEPHWKCGVPQGIVRSSRILSASTRITEVIRVFLLSALLFDNADYILSYSEKEARAICPNV